MHINHMPVRLLQYARSKRTFTFTDVIAIQKTKVLTDMNMDIRPISLTSTLTNIYGRFVANLLIRSIIDKIGKRQFGSLRRSSKRRHALLSFVHYILRETDGSKTS